MTISIGDLTKGEVTGSGLYDELMRTAKAHLQEELEAGRITQQNYATMYLGSMQTNLNAASDFILKRDLVNQQILLVQAQVTEVEKKNELLTEQIAAAKVATETAQYNLDYMLPEQYSTQVAQTALVEQQTDQSSAQTSLISAQITQSTQESLAKVSLSGAQKELVDKQILTETANTTTPTAGLTLTSYNKALAEVDLLNQKKATEAAQTTGDSNSIAGLVGVEMNLKSIQADSFLRDSEQKAAKIFADTFSMLYATDSTNLSANWGLGEAEARLVVDKMRAGISASN